MSRVTLALVSGIGFEVARAPAARTRSLDARGDAGRLDITPVQLDISVARAPGPVPS
jgi:hypothetical protein